MEGKNSEWIGDLSDRDRSAYEEYKTVRKDAGVLDLSGLGKLQVTGRDRVSYLNSMLSNDIRNLRTGGGCYAVLLTHQGRMESDLHVYAFETELWIECPFGSKERVLATLNKYIVSSDVTIEDRTENLGVLSLQGSASQAKMEFLLGASLAAMAPLEHRRLGKEQGISFAVHRDRTGCDGFDIWLPQEEVPALWSRLVNSEQIRPIGQTALNWLRTEAGIPWFGVDMDTQNLPMEFGLNSAISLTKGCYRGQEIMARVTHRGQLNRCLGGVAVNHNELPNPGAEIQSEGTKVGKVTSAAFSPHLGCPLALAILKTDYLHAGARVDVAYGAELCTGEVVKLPLP
jgi:aminomethyltransferase